jgi:hypothetical protein
VQEIIEGAVRAVGWAALKAISFGKHRSDSIGAPVVEGALGLAVIAAGMWLAYRIWR